MKRILVAFVIAISSVNFATAALVGFEITGTFSASTELNGNPLGSDRTFTAIGNIDNTTSESGGLGDLGIFKPLSLSFQIAGEGTFQWVGGNDPLRLYVSDSAVLKNMLFTDETQTTQTWGVGSNAWNVGDIDPNVPVPGLSLSGNVGGRHGGVPFNINLVGGGTLEVDTSSPSGSVSGSFTDPVQPVPEPSSTILLLIGMGAMGHRLRRKSDSVPPGNDVEI